MSTPDSRARPGREETGSFVSVPQLIEDLGPRIYNVALRVLGNTADAEDAVQQAFTDAVRGAAGFRGEASPQTWMWQIAHHAIGKVVRRRARKEVQLVPWSELGPAGEPSASAAHVLAPDDAVDRARLVALAVRCLDALPSAEREILALRDLEGMPVRDVAHTLEISVAAAKSRIHRARLTLKRAVRFAATTHAAKPNNPRKTR